MHANNLLAFGHLEPHPRSLLNALLIEPDFLFQNSAVPSEESDAVDTKVHRVLEHLNASNLLFRIYLEILESFSGVLDVFRYTFAFNSIREVQLELLQICGDCKTDSPQLHLLVRGQ
jgi:hypothetical protein